MRNTLLAVVAAVGLVGCVGGIDTPNDPADPVNPDPNGVGGGANGPAAAEARALFEDTVFPVLEAKCESCHSVAGPSGNTTGFVGTSKADAYVSAVGFQAVVGDWTPTGAPILLKITPGNHQGTSYTQADKDKITAWLTKELSARSGGGGTNPPPAGGESPAEATVRLTKEWSGCMTLANFTAANMKAWGNMRADNSACKTCHGEGEYGNIALDTDNPFFTVISTNKYYMAQYFSADLSGGVANAKMIINTRSFVGVGTGKAPHAAHPRFNLQGSTGMAALQKFYDSTLAAKAAGTCGPPTLLN
jgi:hypothetical protein